jgi:SHS2 domain-containing protein
MPSQQKQYEYMEHTADVKFLAYGKTLEEVFENAALAMFNVIIDTDKVSGETTREVFLKSPDLEFLLVDWLSELLYLFEEV